MSIYALIVLCIIAYTYSFSKREITSPLLEVCTNAFLIIGVVLNIIIWIHLEVWMGILGNLPVILLFVIQLLKNQTLLLQELNELNGGLSSIEKIALKILCFHPLAKFPLLLILCLPILMIISLMLLIFGQKPDSFVRAFTETYKHGFSELDHLCANVTCDGHYLCTVAAKGHKSIVRPLRVGIRNNDLIICNRQLLIANAFEEIIQQRAPLIHRYVRRNYDKVGNLVEKHYHLFEFKLISDVIYLLMKPLEWFFLLVIYTVDKKPENRIARQYTNR